MRKMDDAMWSSVQLDYETRADEPVKALCERYGITTSMLYARARKEEWRGRAERDGEGESSDNRSLIGDLKKLIGKDVAHLKKAATALKGPAIEKHVARMSTLVKLLERLTALEAKQRAEWSTPIITDAGRLRLAAKLEGLRRQLEAERAEKSEAAAATTGESEARDGDGGRIGPSS